MILLSETPTPQQFKMARLQCGMTQRQVADLLGYGSSTRISEIESGAANVSPVRWSLFLLEAGMHPTCMLKERN